MNNLSPQNPESLGSQSEADSLLWEYIQSMSPETIAKLSKPEPEVAELMNRNLRGMLGVLPSEHFGVSITTTREHLGQLLASAMMNGYFIKNAKQRMELENSLPLSE
ncbi:MAG: DUF760 domain-containing protein [Oscillatoria sp. SIO1A7]|nr:DUF760 domain-containing protein [Oscillatoria sp. SIO1A7]